MPPRREKRSKERGSGVQRKTRKLEEPAQCGERGPEGKGASVEGIVRKFEGETGAGATATGIQPKQSSETSEGQRAPQRLTRTTWRTKQMSPRREKRSKARSSGAR